MFCRLRSNVTVHGHRRQKISFKDKADWFSRKMPIESGYQTAIPYFGFLEKFDTWKNSLKSVSKFPAKFMNFQKKIGMYVRATLTDTFCCVSVKTVVLMIKGSMINLLSFIT